MNLFGTFKGKDGVVRGVEDIPQQFVDTYTSTFQTRAVLKNPGTVNLPPHMPRDKNNNLSSYPQSGGSYKRQRDFSSDRKGPKKKKQKKFHGSSGPPKQKDHRQQQQYSKGYANDQNKGKSTTGGFQNQPFRHGGRGGKY